LSIVIEYQNIRKSIVFKPVIRNLINSLIREEKKDPGEISIVFTSNKEILEINRTYLNHNYFTDVITFPERKKERISGDIYISLNQVKINSKKYNEDFFDEVTRVIIHGILHLIGYNDTTDNEKKKMKEKEDEYLCRFRKFDLIEK
jgi:rRNA maturation RNase YbeY